MAADGAAAKQLSTLKAVHPRNREQDAPGWDPAPSEELGPLCWRCKGERVVRKFSKEAKAQVEQACKICRGEGRIAKKRKQTKNADAPGRVSKRTRPLPEGWVVPGPTAPGGVDPERGEELCHLLGHWRIFQRVGGHRWSTDDLVTAWCAGRAWREANGAESAPSACLDLGCGIGTVLMMVAWQFPEARALGIEAQQLSASMARRSLRFNGCDTRCEVREGDIREFNDFTGYPDGKFDLITGTPPYFPVSFSSQDGVARTSVGSLPTCEQSAPARYEFRGGVEAYCQAAAPRLRSASSRFVVCEGFLATNHDRVLTSAASNGLHVLRQLCVHGREDKDPLFAVYDMRLADDQPPPELQIDHLTVRHLGGKRSTAYEEMMLAMGIPP